MTDVRVAFVVATKDRPEDLRRLLHSLSEQTVTPDEIVVVDASADPVSAVVGEFPKLRFKYLRHWPPSASAQRNAGVDACEPGIDLIGFVDDDTTFEPRAIETMKRYWVESGDGLVGAAFNIRNYKAARGMALKRNWAVEAVGLYARQPGRVAASGWQSILGEVEHDQLTEWLPSGAVLWRRSVFDRHRFDQFFDGYSYLEDLDFSYSARQEGKLVVVADAGYFHFPSRDGRITPSRFGEVEVRNRLYFVRKHGLSTWRCHLALGIRFSMSLLSGLWRSDSGAFARARGNLRAFSRKKG